MTTDIKTGYKQTKVGMIPQDWDIVRVGDRCKVIGGYTFKSSDFTKEGKIIVKITNIQDNKTQFSNSDNYVDENLSIDKKFILKEGDFLIAMSGATTGKIGLVSKDFEGAYLNQRVGKFVPNKDIDNRFLYYFFNQNDTQKNIIDNAGSSAQPNIGTGFLENIQLALPNNSKEQQEIAEILSSVDELIDRTDKVIETQKKLKDGLLSKLMSEGIKHTEFKESKLGKIPKDWKVDKLTNICEIIMGQSPDGSTYNESGEGIPFFQGSTDFSVKYPIIRKYTTSPTKIAKNGSILFSVRAPVGDMNWANIDCCIGRGLCSITSIKNNIKYLYYLIDNSKKVFIKNSQGSTFQAINKGDLENLELIFTENIQEQHEIANILNKIDDNIDNENQYRNQLQILKKGLMEKLLIGEIRVKF